MSKEMFDIKTDVIASMKYFQYRIIASHMFDWFNLPPGLDGEKLELMLIDCGSVAFFNTTAGHYVLPFSSNGQLDVYGNLLSVKAVPYNGMPLEQMDYVPRILYDNSARQTFDSYLRAFACRLAFIQKSIAVVERQARFPSITRVNESNKESYARFQSKVDEGYPVIFVDDTMDMQAMNVFDTGFRHEIFAALWDDYNKVEGEIYALLGTMFNVEQNKAAGVGAAETIVNYSQTYALANSRLKQRQRWCEKLNAEFGMKIWCEKTNDFQDIVQEIMSSSVSEPKELAAGAEGIDEAERTKEDENK